MKNIKTFEDFLNESHDINEAFKVGDKAIIKRNKIGAPAGKVGTVIKIDGPGTYEFEIDNEYRIYPKLEGKYLKKI